MNQIKNIFKLLYFFSKRVAIWVVTSIVYYQENKLLSQLLHEKRAPKGTRCTEGFVTVERLF